MEIDRLDCVKCRGIKKIVILGQVEVLAHKMDKGECQVCNHHFLLTQHESLYVARTSVALDNVIDMLNEYGGLGND